MVERVGQVRISAWLDRVRNDDLVDSAVLVCNYTPTLVRVRFKRGDNFTHSAAGGVSGHHTLRPSISTVTQ
jgi:hypothetical protein